MGNEYVIVGDIGGVDGALVCLCGYSMEQAKIVLNRMLTNPTDNDKTLMFGYKNLRIKEVAEKDCWWNHYSLD